MPVEVEELEVKVKAYRFTCPTCGREIRGFFKDQVITNAELHMKRHERRRA